LTDQVTPVRLASHVALLLVAGLVLILSRVHLPDWEVVRLAPVQVEDSAASGPELALNQLPVGGSPLQESGVLLRAPVPFTEIPDRPREGVITYTVQIDDTVLGIGEKFNLDPNTIVWANLDDLTKPFVMAVGEVLLIPPVDGVLHTVEEGDTVDTIATKYRSSAEKIVGFPGNQLAGAETPLTPGQVLMVPDGDRLPPAPPPSQSPSAPWRTQNFVWPAFGRLTQGYWLPAHPAIDIGAPAGSTARAADSGTVITAGWSTVGYGNYVVIRHYDGFVTLYAHLNRIDVSTGEQVERGQQIGIVGSTGHSTGPHLHFEVSLNGRTYNPLIYLP
jgi:murein DD-endopeptidase MepM/ murein hydrolase activator NlpD